MLLSGKSNRLKTKIFLHGSSTVRKTVPVGPEVQINYIGKFWPCFDFSGSFSFFEIETTHVLVSSLLYFLIIYLNIIQRLKLI